MTLNEWIPNSTSWINKGTQPYLEQKVVKEFSSVKMDWDEYCDLLDNTTFTQQYLYSFCELDNGLLVGFNESPSHGWSFPVGKWKNR